MEDSILFSTKKILGYAQDYTAFDHDIAVFINSVFSDLYDLGIGPAGGFAIDDDGGETWTDFIAVSGIPLTPQSIRAYVFLRVRMMHDPSMTGVMKDAMMEQINRFEWRISNARESQLHPLEEFVEEEV